jgi:hypothetical protein
MSVRPVVMAGRWVIGLDLGQKQDPTAVVAMELMEKIKGRDPVTWAWISERKWIVRKAERLELGRRYDDVVGEMRWLANKLAWKGREVTMVVDATGVGAPVVESLERSGIQAAVKPVSITGGARAHAGEGNLWHVPRRDLVDGIRVMLEAGELLLDGEMKGLKELKEELKCVEARGGAGADDLAMALGLACHGARQMRATGRRERQPELWNWSEKYGALWKDSGHLF